MNTYEVTLHHPRREDAPYRWSLTITRPPSEEFPLGSTWQSEEAPLSPGLTEDEARREARDRAALVMAMTEGATVESLAPRGIGDDGQPVDHGAPGA